MRKPISAFICVLFAGLLCFSFTTPQKPEKLENTILTVVRAFKEKDEKTLNELVSKETGIITIFRMGIFDQYEKSDKIDFENPVPNYAPYPDFQTDFKLSFEDLPGFDCDSETWSKTGLFCDKTKTDHLLSQTAINYQKYELGEVPGKEIRSYKKLEKRSHRVVLCDENEGALIFYLTLIDKKWHLTIIDRVTGDCSL